MQTSLPAARLAAVQDHIAAACARARRSRDEVSLLAVSKTRPDSDIDEMYRLGLRSFGENRVVEAVGKQARLPADIEWHMIGHLQSNKGKDCLGFTWLHSLHKVETARALEKAYSATGKTLNVLLEANTGGEEQKEGVRSLDELKRLAEAVSAFHHLSIRGLMTMAPFSPEEGVVRPCFVRLRGWRDALAAEFPQLSWDTLSMGMTNDLGWAIEEGSTMVRIGTALFEGFR